MLRCKTDGAETTVMELTQGRRAILEAAARAGEISRTGAVRAIENSGEHALRREVQQAFESALRGLVEGGTSKRRLPRESCSYFTPKGRSAARKTTTR